MPKKASDAERRRARNLWESGMSDRAVGAEIGFHENTIKNWREKENWQRPDPEAVVIQLPDLPPIEVAADVGDVVAPEDIQEVREAESVAALQARIAELEAEREELSQDVEFRLPSTAGEFRALVGEDYLEMVALNEINEERIRRKLNPVEWDREHPQMVLRMEQLAQDSIDQQTKWSGESNLRTLKMAKRDPNSPTQYRIAAIPMEPTINNFAAAPTEAIQRYVRRGFKLISPQLCQRGPCNRQAAVIGKQFQFQGYCSEAHMNDDPFINAQKVKGVTGTAQSMHARTPGTVIGASG